MKLIENGQALFKTPGPARTATIVMLVMWAMAAIWGWFFVESTVLRDSRAARDFVDFATKVFPWLDNIRKLGPEAEKGLFLQSVCYFAFAPVAIWDTMHRVRTLETKRQLEAAALTVALGFFFIVMLYFLLKPPGTSGLHRMDRFIFVNSWTTPIVSPFIAVGVIASMTLFACCLYRLYVSAIHRGV
jgi:hypothetical protein